MGESKTFFDHAMMVLGINRLVKLPHHLPWHAILDRKDSQIRTLMVIRESAVLQMWISSLNWLVNQKKDIFKE